MPRDKLNSYIKLRLASPPNRSNSSIRISYLFFPFPIHSASHAHIHTTHITDFRRSLNARLNYSYALARRRRLHVVERSVRRPRRKRSLSLSYNFFAIQYSPHRSLLHLLTFYKLDKTRTKQVRKNLQTNLFYTGSLPIKVVISIS